MTPDQINAAFEILGGLLVWMNVYRVYRDKHVAGVSVFPVTFFSLWGIWNLYFYPAVGAWWSFLGGIGLVVANTVWLIQLFYYANKNQNNRVRPVSVAGDRSLNFSDVPSGDDLMDLSNIIPDASKSAKLADEQELESRKRMAEYTLQLMKSQIREVSNVIASAAGCGHRRITWDSHNQPLYELTRMTLEAKGYQLKDTEYRVNDNYPGSNGSFHYRTQTEISW